MRSSQEGVRHALECWNEKFNCAESVLRGVCHAMEIPLTDQGRRMSTPFGGGVGRSEDLCGALSGGVLAMGATLGRVEADDDRMRAYDAAGELFRRFHEEFGTVQCKVLNKSDFKSPEHRERCGRYVAEATRHAIEILSKTKRL